MTREHAGRHRPVSEYPQPAPAGLYVWARATYSDTALIAQPHAARPPGAMAANHCTNAARHPVEMRTKMNARAALVIIAITAVRSDLHAETN